MVQISSLPREPQPRAGETPVDELDAQSTGVTRLSDRIGAVWELRSWLRLACSIAEALGHLHARGLVHRDIRPANILVHADGRVSLSGLGRVSRLPRERLSPVLSDVIAGALPYMSPEQTGRMNRSLDSRSDLYSLGITLYEMATGTLPFSADSATEWIHCHIAREPASAAKVLPSAVHAIVRKLLSKNAEDRYQTALGLTLDLRRCLQALETLGDIEDFPLGTDDVSDRLLLPEKLYGREGAVAVLYSAFERVVASERAELVMVSGCSGTGKSSVVSELHKLLVSHRALFATGKFDQHRRDVPYSTLAFAFQTLLREILTTSDREFASWQERLRDATAQNGRLLADLVPELFLVIGEQPPVVELPPQEAKRRFERLLTHLLRAFASHQGGLVLFLDDLQWSDRASLDLLEALFSGDPVEKLLLIGAYRDNEVGADHPLTSILASIRQRAERMREVVLAPLAESEVEQLVADALRDSRDRIAPLARLIRERSGGNPFFVIQLLSGLVDEGLVAYDHRRGRWGWDSDRVMATRVTDNVVELMVGKLGRLPAETQAALQELACLGNVSPLGLLTALRPNGLHEALWEAVRAGLVFRGEDRYGFVHDRVQEAAYALLAAHERPSAHLQIARRLDERLSPTQREEAIFDLVNQYNRARQLLDGADEHSAVARLNLSAGRRARAASAHDSAKIYFTAGRALLADDVWATDHPLVFELELRLAEGEFFAGALESMEQRLDLLWERARDPMERASVTALRIEMHATVHRNHRAVESGLMYLRSVGIDWPTRPSDEQAQLALASLWEQLGERSHQELFELPLMTDVTSRTTMDVLARLLGSSLSNSPNLLVLCVAYMTQLSLERGNTDASAQAYIFLAIVLLKRNERARDAYRFGQLAVDLVERRGLERFKAGTWVVFAMGVLPWTQHLATSRDVLRRAFQAGTANGDIAYAGYAGYLSVAARLGAGDPLDEVQSEAEEARHFSERTGFAVGVDFISTRISLIQSLRGLTPRLGWLADEDERQARFQAKFDAEWLDHVLNLTWLTLCKLQARFLAGELEEALAAAEQARALLWSIPERFERAEFHFYSALVHAAAARPSIVREHREELLRWNADCPANFGCRLAIVSAELARLENRELDAERFYEDALRLAREQHFVQIEALAGELAAQFHRARGYDTIADAYLVPAREAYVRWGALGKVRQLDERFPRLRAAGRDPARVTRVDLSLGQLDLATVVQVSQTISAEIVLDRLLEKVLTIAVESAGAERGLLLLPQAGELQIEARAVVSAQGVEVQRSAAFVRGDELPESILRYVARTHSPVILADAATERGAFANDAYVQGKRVRSLLCLPLLKQTRLIGVLHLENKLSANVFTPRRIALLELLASQAAISLENARLHTELGTVQDGLRDALRENGLMIDSIPAQAWYTRPDGWAERFNRPWLDYAGLSDREAAGWGWSNIIHPEDAPKVQRRWQEIRASGAPAELELRQRRHDGVYRWFLVHVRPFKDESGQVVRWYGTNLDIEELKQAQESLRRNQAFLAEGQRISGIGSFLWRLDADQVEVSDELYRIFGFEPGTPITLTRIAERVLPDDRPLLAQKVAIARKGIVDHEYEVRLQMPDGSLKYVQTSSHPNQDQDGKQEILGVLQDITERRRSEQALSLVRSELENMTRVASLGVLSASITHEVNQPLSGILINSGACLRMLSADPPDVSGAIETVRRTLRDGTRAGEVIQRLRALFSKKDTSAEPLDLNEALREVLALSISELHRNRVALRSELAQGLKPVMGDRIQLQQVMMNLVHNASEAMTGVDDRARELLVTTEPDGREHVRVSVRDVGVGISPEGTETLFKPFHTTKAHGMGMGLAVSRSIVERHGGRLRAVPNLDGPGTTFSFSVPCAAPPP